MNPRSLTNISLCNTTILSWYKNVHIIAISISGLACTNLITSTSRDTYYSPCITSIQRETSSYLGIQYTWSILCSIRVSVHVVTVMNHETVLYCGLYQLSWIIERLKTRNGNVRITVTTCFIPLQDKYLLVTTLAFVQALGLAF